MPGSESQGDCGKGWRKVSTPRQCFFYAVASVTLSIGEALRDLPGSRRGFWEGDGHGHHYLGLLAGIQSVLAEWKEGVNQRMTSHGEV